MTEEKTCAAVVPAPTFKAKRVQGGGLDRKVMRDTSFRAMAVAELRGHRWCGDCYPNNGWPGVNEALAQYALERRVRRQLTTE